MQSDFTFQFMQKNGKRKGNKMTVIPEEHTQILLLKKAFLLGAKFRGFSDIQQSVRNVELE